MSPQLHGLPWRRGRVPWGRGPNSKFSRYVSWLYDAQSASLDRSSDVSALFPALLPYLEVLQTNGDALFGEKRRVWWAKSFLNSWIAWCNFMVLGCPTSVGAECEPLAGYRCVQEVRSLTDKLLGEVLEFMDDELCTGAVQLDGNRLSIEEALNSLQSLHGGYGVDHAVPGVTEEKLSSAIPVVASRVAIPEWAGSVDPLDWLPEERRVKVAQLEKLRKPEGMWKEIVPACHRVARSEEAGLVRKLLAHNMVELIPEDDLPRDSNNQLLTGGFFCVRKSEKEDRLIYDRRPENATMERLNWSKLPAGACLTRLLLEPDEFLRGSGDDLRTYYYSLALPKNWVRFNSVGRRVDPKIVEEFGGVPGRPYRVAMKVLGMGDTNACCIAQAVHEHVLSSQGLLQPHTKLVYGKPVPRGPLLEGAYLDDLLVVHRKKMDSPVPLDGSFMPPMPRGDDLDVVATTCAERAYESAKLERALHKSFRCETEFKAWGASVDGVKGTVGAPLTVRRQVWTLLWRVVREGRAMKSILQRLLGYVCFCFQYRREFYALQHHIYKYLDSMPEKKICKLPAHIVDELRSIGLHLPFCSWKMRRSFHESLLATDATPSSGGATRAELPIQLARALWQHCDVKGEAVRLDRGVLESIVGEDEPREPSRYASTVAETLPWKITSSYHFRQTSHINLQEARALKREVSLLASDVTSHGKVQLCLNDSRVVTGAVAKGRSSSFKLNGILRSMIPYLTIANLALGILWIETKSNPADYPSRFCQLPSPRPTPTWLQRLGVRKVLARGLEVFAGSARLTRSVIAAGLSMWDPIDVLYNGDAFDSNIDSRLLQHLISWLWLAPPCGTFSALRNLDRGGPLRPKGNPRGNEDVEEVRRGNQLWLRALELAWLAWKLGIPFFLEHPRGSKAWLWRESQELMNAAGVFVVEAHWCEYDDSERQGGLNKKPTRIVGTGPWLLPIIRKCSGLHQHGKPLRGSRAKLAGAYPWGFCEEFAAELKKWYGQVA